MSVENDENIGIYSKNTRYAEQLYINNLYDIIKSSTNTLHIH